MEMSVILLAVGVVLAWWALAKPRARPATEERTTTSLEQELVPEERPKSPSEKLSESLNSVREAIREQAELENEALREQVAVATGQLAAARKIAKELGISDAMTSIADEMTNWHAWSRLENYDFSENLVEGLTYLGGSHDEEKQKRSTLN